MRKRVRHVPAFLMMLATTSGCDEAPSGPPPVGWTPPKYSLNVDRAVVAPRGDTVSIELHTGAPVGSVSARGVPTGVTLHGLQACCPGGDAVVDIHVDSTAELGTDTVEFRLDPDDGGYLTNIPRTRLSVVPNQTGATLPLSTVIATGAGPSAIEIDPSGARASVPNPASQDITSFNLSEHWGAGTTNVRPGSRPRSPSLGDGPVALAFPGAGDTVYVANRYSDYLSRIVLRTRWDPLDVPVGGSPSGVAIDSAAGRAYVTSWDENAVTVVDLSNHVVTETIPVGVGPEDIDFDGNGRAYVTNWGSDDVSVIDLATGSVVATVPVGYRPMSLTVSPGGENAYVANSGSDDLSEIELETLLVTRTIVVGDAPHGVAVSADGATAYVANAESEDVSIVDLVAGEVVGTVAAGAEPVAVALRPDGAFLYVANAAGNDVYVYNLNVVPGGPGPTSLPR